MNMLIFITALIAVESGGNINAVGDTHLRNKAYGLAQIRQPYLDDVNRIAGTAYTLQEVASSRALTAWTVTRYVRHYGERYTRITGLPLTYEIASRIHNGGPDGWRKSSTIPHWRKMQAIIQN